MQDIHLNGVKCIKKNYVGTRMDHRIREAMRSESESKSRLQMPLGGVKCCSCGLLSWNRRFYVLFSREVLSLLNL